MAQMAASAVAKGEDDLGAIQSPPRQVSAAGTSNRPCHLSRVAKLCLEEPDAGNPHVRIRGGPGRATGRVYPIRAREFSETVPRPCQVLPRSWAPRKTILPPPSLSLPGDLQRR